VGPWAEHGDHSHEVMPLARSTPRDSTILPLTQVRASLAQRFTLRDIAHRTGGPARYVRVRERAASSASSLRSATISARAAIAFA